MLSINLKSDSALRPSGYAHADLLIESGTNYMGVTMNNTKAASVEECGQLCRDSFNYTCNTFVFCNQLAGCLAGASGPYPLGTCTLKLQVTHADL